MAEDNDAPWILFTHLYPKEHPYASLQRMQEMTLQIGEQGLFWVILQLTTDIQRTYQSFLEGVSQGRLLHIDPMSLIHLWNFLNTFYLYLCARHPFRCNPSEYLPEIRPTRRGGIKLRWCRKDKTLELEFFPETTESNTSFCIAPLQGEPFRFHCPPDEVADAQFVEAILAELCSSAYYPPDDQPPNATHT